LVIIAVRELQGMPEFMRGLRRKAALKERFISGQSIEFLTETVAGDDAAGSSHLGFPKNEGKDRNVQVDHRDAQNAPGTGMNEGLHCKENL